MTQLKSLLLIDGLDISKPAEYITNNACVNTQNFYVTRGLLAKRYGSAALGSSFAERIMNGCEFVQAGTKYNIAIGVDKIKMFNTGTDAWVDITGTDLTGTLDDAVDIAFPLLSGLEIVCIANGIDAIRKWNASGNTAALGGTPPVAKFIQEYKTYLVCANVQGGVDVGSRIQWCDTANPENWSSGNAGSQDLIEDGGDITGLNTFGNYLCIHKRNSIYLGYLVSSNDIFKFDRKATGIGTICNNTIQNLPIGLQIFLAYDGFYLFNGITASLIPAPVNEEIRDSLNATYAHRSWSVLVKELNEVWIGVPIGEQTSGETVYKYNYTTGVMYKDYRSGANAAWLGSASDSLTWDEINVPYDQYSGRWNDQTSSAGSDQINIGDTSGVVSKVSKTGLTDAGTAINAFWESKDYELETQTLARWLKFELWAKGGSITVQYSIDHGSTWTTLDTVTLSDDFPLEISPDILYLDVVSSKIRFKFINNESDESLFIKQFVLDAIPWGVRA